MAGRRVRYAVIATLTILLGVAVHLHGSWLPHVIRDKLGDALWAGMIYWIASAAVPADERRWRIGAALMVCTAVEVAQLWHPYWLESVRHTLVGHLMLGSDFDAGDLLAYAAGVLGAAAVDSPRGSSRGRAVDVNPAGTEARHD